MHVSCVCVCVCIVMFCIYTYMQSAQEREQAMAAQRTQDQQESAAQLKKLADRDAQVQEQKSKLLHADVHSGVLLDRLREAARDLGRVGAEVQAMAAQVRDTNERLDEARIREAEMEKAHAAGLAVVQEALQGSQARAETVEAQRVQAVADAEVLRQKLEEMESTRSLRTEEEAGQDGREKKQALEAALAAVETARCDAEKVRVQWRAAEEREARAATVVAELTKLVKDQREKILDAQRDGKETERQLRAALQEALDELQSLQLRQRELARGEKEAGHLRKQLAEERRLVDDLRAELDDVLYERQRLLDLNAEGDRGEAEAERARDEERYDGERDGASAHDVEDRERGSWRERAREGGLSAGREAPKYASPRPDGAGKGDDGDRLTAERETWMQEAEGFRDTIRIKDKILQDQQDSIDKLKEQVVALQAEVGVSVCRCVVGVFWRVYMHACLLATHSRRENRSAWMRCCRMRPRRCVPLSFNYSLRPSLMHRPPGCVLGNKDNIARLPDGLHAFENA